MPPKFRCPHCRSAVEVDESLLGSAVECPGCGERFDVPAAQSRRPKKAAAKGTVCPACKKSLPPKSIFCTHCGFDFKRKRRLQSSFEPEKQLPKRSATEPTPSRGPQTALAEVSWRQILGAPFDLELTLTETIELTFWSLFWVGVFAVLLGALLFLGTGSIFAVSAVIAGILRVWMIEKDLSILDLLKIVIGLLAFSTVVAYPLDWLLPNPDENPNRVPAFTFEIVILLIVVAVFLRMVSFFFGRYFAIVRRAALGTMFSEDDRGGLIDLGFALIVAVISFAPLMLTLLAAQLTSWLQGNELGELNDGARYGFIGLAMLALVWSAFYLPMATAAVALRHSARPGIVFDWIGKAMPEYGVLVALLLPFHFAVNALALGTGIALGRLGAMTRFGLIVEFIYAFFAGIIFSQYAMAVTCVAVGLLMRRHELLLQWRRWIDAR